MHLLMYEVYIISMQQSFQLDTFKPYYTTSFNY